MGSEYVVRLYMSGTGGQKPGHELRTSTEPKKAEQSFCTVYIQRNLAIYVFVNKRVGIADLEINCPLCTSIIHNS